MTDRDGPALYRAICENPDEDTPRLVYADWCDENGDEARAEVIRLQVEMDGWGATPPADAETKVRRESDFLAAHGESWRACPCPKCRGTGQDRRKDETFSTRVCRTCGGSGDLFIKQYPAGKTARPVTFSRGFPDAVECTLAELGEQCRECGGNGNGVVGLPGGVIPKDCRSCNGTGFKPFPWAAAVVRESAVMRFVVTDRRVGSEHVFSWLKDDALDEPYSLPGFLFEATYELHKHRQRDGDWLYFDSANLAHDTMHCAACQLVRRAVYGVTTQPEERP